MRTGEWGRLGWDAVASGFVQETAARAAAGRVRVSVPLLLGQLQIVCERESSAAAYGSCRQSDTWFCLLYLFVKASSCNSDGSVGVNPPSVPLKPRHDLGGVQNAPAAPASDSPVG